MSSGSGGRPSVKRRQSIPNGASPANEGSFLASPANAFSDSSAFKTHSAPGTPPMRASSPANGGYLSAAAVAARADRFKLSGAGGGEEDITALFHTMRHQREAIRQQYIKAGVLPDPSKAQELDLAQKFKGTCPDMCPEFEQVEREMQKELDLLETLEGSSGRVDPERAVKKYRRPAAGREVPLPEDVRPPAVLKSTLDYLFHSLLPESPFAPEFNQIQAFLWDRTRAIRQDFIVQSEGEDLTIECHERIARYHILTLHFRGGLANEDGSLGGQVKNADGTTSENSWSEQQELEQLRKSEWGIARKRPASI
jgi:SAC3/GANP family